MARLLTGTGKQSIDRHSSYPVGGPSPHKPGECGEKGNHSRGKMAASLPLLGKMPTPVRPQGSPYIPKFQMPSNSSHRSSLKSCYSHISSNLDSSLLIMDKHIQQDGLVDCVENVDVDKIGDPNLLPEQAWTKEEERQALRKLDWVLIPLLVYILLSCSMIQ